MKKLKSIILCTAIAISCIATKALASDAIPDRNEPVYIWFSGLDHTKFLVPAAHGTSRKEVTPGRRGDSKAPVNPKQEGIKTPADIYMQDETHLLPRLESAIMEALFSVRRGKLVALDNRADRERFVDTCSYRPIEVKGFTTTMLSRVIFDQKDPNKVKRIETEAEVSLQLVDMKTHEVINTMRLKDSDYSSSWRDDRVEELMRNVIRHIAQDVAGNLNKMLPTQGKVVDLAEYKETKKGVRKAETIIIDLGTNQKVDGARYEINVLRPNNGIMVPIKIGTCRVRTILDGNTSVCSVTTGEADVYTALDVEKETLHIIEY